MADIQWEIVASIDAVRQEHPEWTEEQVRTEFNRLGRAALQKQLDEIASRRRPRKAKASI